MTSTTFLQIKVDSQSNPPNHPQGPASPIQATPARVNRSQIPRQDVRIHWIGSLTAANTTSAKPSTVKKNAKRSAKRKARSEESSKQESATRQKTAMSSAFSSQLPLQDIGVSGDLLTAKPAPKSKLNSYPLTMHDAKKEGYEIFHWDGTYVFHLRAGTSLTAEIEPPSPLWTPTESPTFTLPVARWPRATTK